MFDKIFDVIKKYDNIVIAHHIGVDPDAMASTVGLKNSIMLTFPNKKVRLAGSGSNRFSYFGKLDKPEEVKENTLLIVCDTPDIRRIDGAGELSQYSDVVKLDHHPFIDKFGEYEYIDTTASSAAQIILELINETPLLMDKEIAEQLFWGIVSDTNRFMFSCTSSKTFHLVGDLVKKYDLEVAELYKPLYARPISEVRLEGYISTNMFVTENGVGYIKISDEKLQEFHTDAAAPGNMIGDFNYINEVLVWLFITEDVKNNNYRISIRSRGPVINTVAEKYNGGGHVFASGAKITDINDSDKLIQELDSLCKKYKKEEKVSDKNED